MRKFSLTIFLLDIIVWAGILYKIYQLPTGQAQMEVIVMGLALILLVFSSIVLFVQNDDHSSSDVLTFLILIVGWISVLYSISVLLRTFSSLD